MLSKMDILFSPKGENNKGILVFLWIVYAVVTALLISNHAPWRDEAFVWLIAREASWLDIFKEAGAQVAPSLWYYILAVPAKMGMPYWTMQGLHWFGACLAVGIFLFRAPFSILFKALFIFSYYVAYEHAAIARVYMLTLLFMWITCSFYAQRYQRPILFGFLVALLAHTSFFGILVSIFLGIDFFFLREGDLTRRQLGALVIISLAILLSVFGFTFDKFSVGAYLHPAFFFHPDRIREVFSYAYLPPEAGYFFSDGIKAIFGFIAPWLGVLYAILTLGLLKRWRAYGPAVFFVFSWFLICYIAVFKYLWPAPRHYSFCLIYAVMVLWLGKVRSQAPKTIMESLIGILFVIAFSLGILSTVAQGYVDSRRPLSGAQLMAQYLIDHKLDDKTFIAEEAQFVSSILPYMPKASLWDPKKLKPVRYIHFDSSFSDELKISQILSRMDRSLTTFCPTYFIAARGRPDMRMARRLKLIYIANGQEETFRLYLVTHPGKRHDAGL